MLYDLDSKIEEKNNNINIDDFKEDNIDNKTNVEKQKKKTKLKKT